MPIRKLFFFFLIIVILPGTTFGRTIDFIPGPQSELGQIGWVAATGDLNSDGNIDIVGLSSVSDLASVLFGSGDVAFQAEVTLIAGCLPSVFTLGDANDDGYLDILIAGLTGTMTIL